jgi:hypothetical protein
MATLTAPVASCSNHFVTVCVGALPLLSQFLPDSASAFSWL